MQRISQRTTTQLAIVWQHTLSSVMQLALTILCSLLLVSGALAQEQRPEPLPTPEPLTPEASPMEKPPDPNETLTPSQLASQVVDGDIVFTSPGQSTYTRDIRLSDNFGGLRFFGANSLTTTPAGAAIQFFGNNASPFNGQLYLDSGASNSAALIFRTALPGGTITERMRVTAAGNVGIGTTTPDALGGTRLDVKTGAGGALTAVSGTSTNPNGVGVFGTATGSNSIAVWGLHNFDGIGVYGRSINGYGVLGQTNSSYGVYGDSTSGPGVYGRSNNNQGVFGTSNSGTGVYGQSNTGFAGYFVGSVHVTGTLSKAGGSFKIDHPLDPTNKYLSHSFVESPDMLNIYNGNVTTDAKGQATVTLPAYFAALNRDYRYQLTVIGQFAQAIVAREIKHNRFTIKTNKPQVKVSWQVTGIRQDAYAEAHRIRVEEDKPATERGTYLHPEAFGQPKEKGVERAHRPEQLPLARESAQQKEQ